MEGSSDIAVVGLGAMGSATTAALSRRGHDVLAFDRFTPPHNRGSSHGRTRVIREAYFEHPLYVPLVQAASCAWRALEERSSRRLFTETGALLVGRRDGPLIAGTRLASQRHQLALEELTIDDIQRRFPHFRPWEDAVALFEPHAGVLFPEECVEAFLDEARQGGARLHYEEPVVSWEAGSDGIALRTHRGRYVTQRLLLAAGAWLPSLAPWLALEIERQVMHWFEPRTDSPPATGEHLPVFLIEENDGRLWYGLPDFGDGVKVALHHGGKITTADSLQRSVDPEEVADIRRLLERRLPSLNGRPRNACVCMYTNTADSHFVIDSHPEHPQVLLASACSGHGFKFASLFGEILADLLTTGETSYDLSPFRRSRPSLLAG